jgi:hypothetical protein
MSITRRYIVFDEIEKEETAALLYEKISCNLFIQCIKTNIISLIEQTTDSVMVNNNDEL